MVGKVQIVGAFPPPLGGAAKNNEIIASALEGKGATVERLSISGSGLAHRRTLTHHIQRLGKNAAALLALVREPSRATHVYIIPDGGLGLAYSAVLWSVAVLLGREVTAHHRTYLYLDRRTPLMAAVASFTRRKTHHVFLSAGMRQAFEKQYGAVVGSVVGNATFVEQHVIPVATPISPALVLGHLSNLCRDKGFFDVARTFEMARESGRRVILQLAGPILEPEVETVLANLAQRFGDDIQYLGPLHGLEKYNFYMGLDVFLFPTRFAQEAQPNVIFEAMSAGVHIVASERGCIAEMLDCGRLAKVVPRGADFSAAAAEYLEDYEAHLSTRRQERRCIIDHFHAARGTSEIQYKQLLSRLLS
ncbi:MAG: glycosyltransferase family 4 protein [Parvibaculum sp.]|nr:glycosyltransferase family 4 protein [Parvibaculum sp.]